MQRMTSMRVGRQVEKRTKHHCYSVGIIDVCLIEAVGDARGAGDPIVST